MSEDQVVIRGLGPGNQDRLMAASQVIAGLVKLLGEGRLDEAARVYSRCSIDLGYQLTQKVSADRRMQKAAASMLYRARDYAKAAMVCESLDELDKAAALYEKADDPYMAAEMYARIGNLARAATMYERAGNLEQAAGLYLEVDERERAADCYRRIDRPFAAGRLYHEIGKDQQAVELLQRVPQDHVDYLEAIALLAELLAKNGYATLAEKKLLSVVESQGVTDANIGLWYTLADLYARTGKADDAKHVFGELLQHDFHYRDAAERLKRLEEGVPEEDVLEEVEVDDEVEDLDAPVDEVVSVDASLGAFRDLPLFEDLSLDDIRALDQIALDRVFDPGEVIIEQGAHGEALYVVIEGTVEVKRTDASTEKTLARLPRGAHVGEMSLIDDAPTSARVVAAEPVRVLALPVAEFRSLLETRPALALRIYKVLSVTLCRRLRATDAKLQP